MFANEFEQKLLEKCFYFESPSFFIPGNDMDAEGYSAEQLLDILAHEQNATGSFRRMVRKRSEQVGYTSYYFKDGLVSEYFKVVVPNSTTTQGGNWMNVPEVPDWAKNIAMHAVSGFLLGFSATWVSNPVGIDDLQPAIYGAAVVGLYSAFKEVLAYAQTLLPKPVNTKAGPVAAAKPGKKLVERML